MVRHLQDVESAGGLGLERLVSVRDGLVSELSDRRSRLVRSKSLRDDVLSEGSNSSRSVRLGGDSPGRLVVEVGHSRGVDVVDLLEVQVSEESERALVSLLLSECERSIVLVYLAQSEKEGTRAKTSARPIKLRHDEL